MMLGTKVREELMVLLEAVVNGTISPGQHRRLEEILSSSAEARSIYLDYLDLHAGLRALALGKEDEQQVAWITNMVEAEVSAAKSGKAGRAARLQGWSMFLVGCMVLGVLVAWLAGRVFPTRLPAVPPTPPQHVATVVRWAGVAAEDATKPSPGQRLAPRDVVAIRDGTVEIVFDGGQHVVLQGASRLRIESATRAELIVGRALVRSDEAGGRFCLLAGDACYWHRSAEFSMELGQDGTCALHVRVGEVRRERISEDGKRRLSRETVVAGRARVFSPQTDAGSPISFEPSRFAVAFGDESAVGTGDILAEEDFSAVSPDPVALVASRGAEFEDGPGWSGRWVVGPGDVPHILADQWFGFSHGSRQVPGVLSVEGQAYFHRRLAHGLSFNRSTLYYLGFIVKWDRAASGQGGWFSVSLDSADNPSVDPVTVGLWVERQLLFARAGDGVVRRAISLETGREYIFLIKLVTDGRGQTELFARVFTADQPIDELEPDAWNVVLQVTSPDTLPDCVFFRVETACRWYLDQLRLAKSWGGAVQPWLRGSTASETITTVLPDPHPQSRVVYNP